MQGTVPSTKDYFVQTLQRPNPPWSAAAEVQTGQLSDVPTLQYGGRTTPFSYLHPGLIHPGNTLSPVLHTRRLLLGKSRNSGSFSSIPRREDRRPGPPLRNSEPYHCDKEKCSESLSSQARSNSQPQSGSHCQVIPWSRNNLSNMGGRPQDSEPVPLPRSLQASPLGGAGW